MSKNIPSLKKSLGQHFLHAEGICRKIISLLDLKESDNILEIGPGAGALTKYLENLPHARLLLLEKDDFWGNERKAAAREGTEIIVIDALKFDWQGICGAEKWKIVGNLPYNAASPLIWDILSQCRCLEKAVFMVQKEVGQRLAALPGNRNYGALTVWAQSYARIKYRFSVGPGAFNPPPKVDSAVLTFDPLSPAALPAHPQSLAAILRLCFQNRRKQLGGIFKRAKAEYLLDVLQYLKISSTARPEDLAPEIFQRLAAACAGKTP